MLRRILAMAAVPYRRHQRQLMEMHQVSNKTLRFIYYFTVYANKIQYPFSIHEILIGQQPKHEILISLYS